MPDLHSRTADLVDRFAAALKDKLAAAEQKYGYSNGWAEPGWMDECRAKLIEHVHKGDPRDVAAYCAFLWHHGERTALEDQFIYDVTGKWPTKPAAPVGAPVDAAAQERERCAGLCEDLAKMMEDGAGEPEPGGRLRQAARNIREAGHKPLGIGTADLKKLDVSLLFSSRQKICEALRIPLCGTEQIVEEARRLKALADGVRAHGTAQAMADEYAAWIDFYHAGNGDYAGFLGQRLKPGSLGMAASSVEGPHDS